MATDDIETIKQELQGFFEVEMPYKFEKGDLIKYITLCGDSEKFYYGGTYVSIGHEKIIVTNGGKQWSFPTKIRDDENDVIYVSRIFLKKNMTGGTKHNNQDKQTIQAQQMVIETMTKTIQKLTKENQTYKQAIHRMKQI